MSYVYFIQCGEYIKIGKSVDPWHRLASLQTANPESLIMLAIAPGGGEFEAGLHTAFEGARQRGEWFERTARLDAFIAAVAMAFPDLQKKPVVSTDSQERRRQPTADGEGWIEYGKRGTRNPKRYAYRRQWVWDNGRWVKSVPVRIKEIPPMTEAEYRAMMAA